MTRATWLVASTIAVAIIAGAGARGRAQADEPPLPPPPEEWRRLYDEGTALTRREHWGDALDRFERSAALHPNAKTTYNMGSCEYRLARMTRAHKLLRQALRENEASHLLPDSLVVEVRGTAAQLDAELARADLTLDPPNATIAVDGRPLEPLSDEEPLVLVAGVMAPGLGQPLPPRASTVLLDPGRHHFTLTHAGYKAIVIDRDFVPGTRVVLRWSMERIPATLRITSPNLGAVVTVDDLDVGAVPVEVQRPAGRYRVTVRKPRYDPYQTQIEASPGQETSLNVPLKHKYEIERRWWFWSALVVGAAAVVVPIVATRPGPSPDLGGLQWLSKP